jgi:outer membrane protein assembly factor BamD
MKKLLFFALLFWVATACKFQKIQKNDDWRVRYKAAVEYYDKGDYYHAGVLLEELIPILKGSPEGEKAHFYYAYCNFEQGMYLVSSHYFKSFFDTYNRSTFAEEALYMYAYSLYADSSPIYLDQQSTNTAIDAFQEFLNRYPQSKYAVQANNLIAESRLKLETKAYNLAKLYHKLKREKASIITFENFEKDYPDSNLQEEAFALKIESQHLLAVNSFETKKRERYEALINFCQKFIDKYPQSNYLASVQDYLSKGQIGLKKALEYEKKIKELQEQSKQASPNGVVSTKN